MKNVFLTCLLALVAAVGCNKGTSRPPETPPATPAAGAESALLAKLAAADKLDGAEDKVVVRCASCALGMDGKPGITLETHGYTLRFCAQGCKTAFAKDIDKSIAAMKIPEE